MKKDVLILLCTALLILGINNGPGLVGGHYVTELSLINTASAQAGGGKKPTINSEWLEVLKKLPEDDRQRIEKLSEPQRRELKKKIEDAYGVESWWLNLTETPPDERAKIVNQLIQSVKQNKTPKLGLKPSKLQSKFELPKTIGRRTDSIDQQIAAKSRDAVRFFGIRSSAEGTTIQIGRELLKISKSEFTSLVEGKDIPQKLSEFLTKTPSLKKLILSGRKESDKTERKEELQVVEALDLRWGDSIKFYIGNDMDLGQKNVKRLRNIHGPEDIAAYIPPDEAQVRSYDVIAHLEDELKEARIQTIRDISPTAIEVSNIIIITGHKDERLRNYIEKLGAAGCLRDKEIFMFSCHEPTDETFYSRVIKEFGTVRIRFLPRTINPQAVEETLYGISQMINEMPKSGVDLRELHLKAVDRALKNNASRSDDLLKEIEKMRGGVTQVSRLETPPRECTVTESAKA